MRTKYVPIQKWHDRERCVKDRYVLVFVPEHPKAFRGGWYYEHRLAAEKQFGRVLQKWETVHHISGDRTDNTWHNLFVCTRTEHDKAA